MFFFISFVFISLAAIVAFNIFGAQKVQATTRTSVKAKPKPKHRKEFDENGNRIRYKLSELQNDPRPPASEEVQERERARAYSTRKALLNKPPKVELSLEPEFVLVDEQQDEIKKELFALIDSPSETDKTAPSTNEALEAVGEHLVSHSLTPIAGIEPVLNLALAVETIFKYEPKIEKETKKVVTKKIKKQRKS